MKSLIEQIKNIGKNIGEKQNDLEIQMSELQLQQELTNCKLELAEMTSETQ